MPVMGSYLKQRAGGRWFQRVALITPRMTAIMR